MHIIRLIARRTIHPAIVLSLLLGVATGLASRSISAQDCPECMATEGWTCPVPSSLSQMVVPSHLLLSKDGIVVNKWPGTHQDPVVRQQMVNQITTDVIEHLRTSG